MTNWSGDILVVEDNLLVLDAIVDYVQCVVGFETSRIHRAGSVTEALGVLETNRVGVLMTDVNLGGGRDGLDMVRALPRAGRPYVIAMSAIPGLRGVDACLSDGTIDGFLQKPFLMDDLREALRSSGKVPIGGT